MPVPNPRGRLQKLPKPCCHEIGPHQIKDLYLVGAAYLWRVGIPDPRLHPGSEDSSLKSSKNKLSPTTSPTQMLALQNFLKTWSGLTVIAWERRTRFYSYLLGNCNKYRLYLRLRSFRLPTCLQLRSGRWPPWPLIHIERQTDEHAVRWSMSSHHYCTLDITNGNIAWPLFGFGRSICLGQDKTVQLKRNNDRHGKECNQHYKCATLATPSGALRSLSC